MKWYPSILEVVKADELKTISKGFNFVFEFSWSEEDRVLKHLNKIKSVSL